VKRVAERFVGQKRKPVAQKSMPIDVSVTSGINATSMVLTVPKWAFTAEKEFEDGSLTFGFLAGTSRAPLLLKSSRKAVPAGTEATYVSYGAGGDGPPWVLATDGTFVQLGRSSNPPASSSFRILKQTSLLSLVRPSLLEIQFSY
jgi:hypothetical protein